MTINTRKEALEIFRQLYDTDERQLMITSNLSAYVIYNGQELEKARELEGHTTDDPFVLGEVIARGHNVSHVVVLPPKLVKRGEIISSNALQDFLHNATMNP